MKIIVIILIANAALLAVLAAYYFGYSRGQRASYRIVMRGRESFDPVATPGREVK